MVRKILLSLKTDQLTTNIPLREWLQQRWRSESGTTSTKEERWKINL